MLVARVEINVKHDFFFAVNHQRAAEFVGFGFLTVVIRYFVAQRKNTVAVGNGDFALAVQNGVSVRFVIIHAGERSEHIALSGFDNAENAFRNIIAPRFRVGVFKEVEREERIIVFLKGRQVQIESDGYRAVFQIVNAVFVAGGNGYANRPAVFSVVAFIENLSEFNAVSRHAQVVTVKIKGVNDIVCFAERGYGAGFGCVTAGSLARAGFGSVGKNCRRGGYFPLAPVVAEGGDISGFGFAAVALTGFNALFRAGGGGGRPINWKLAPDAYGYKISLIYSPKTTFDYTSPVPTLTSRLFKTIVTLNGAAYGLASDDAYISNSTTLAQQRNLTASAGQASGGLTYYAGGYSSWNASNPEDNLPYMTNFGPLMGSMLPASRISQDALGTYVNSAVADYLGHPSGVASKINTAIPLYESSEAAE